ARTCEKQWTVTLTKRWKRRASSGCTLSATKSWLDEASTRRFWPRLGPSAAEVGLPKDTPEGLAHPGNDRPNGSAPRGRSKPFPYKARYAARHPEEYCLPP